MHSLVRDDVDDRDGDIGDNGYRDVDTDGDIKLQVNEDVRNMVNFNDNHNNNCNRYDSNGNFNHYHHDLEVC